MIQNTTTYHYNNFPQFFSSALKNIRGRPNSNAISPVVAVRKGEGRVCNSIFSLLTPPPRGPGPGALHAAGPAADLQRAGAAVPGRRQRGRRVTPPEHRWALPPQAFSSILLMPLARSIGAHPISLFFTDYHSMRTTQTHNFPPTQSDQQD